MRVCSGPLENGDPAARPVALEGRHEMQKPQTTSPMFAVNIMQFPGLPDDGGKQTW